MRMWDLINAVGKSWRRFEEPKRRMGFEWDLNKQLKKIIFRMEERTPRNAWGQDPASALGPVTGHGWNSGLWTGQERAGQVLKWGRCPQQIRNICSPHPGPQFFQGSLIWSYIWEYLYLKQLWFGSAPHSHVQSTVLVAVGVFKLIIGPKMIFWALISVSEPPVTNKDLLQVRENASGHASVARSHGRMCGWRWRIEFVWVVTYCM